MSAATLRSKCKKYSTAGEVEEAMNDLIIIWRHTDASSVPGNGGGGVDEMWGLWGEIFCGTADLEGTQCTSPT
jgi:hypothetical protein